MLALLVLTGVIMFIINRVLRHFNAKRMIAKSKTSIPPPMELHKILKTPEVKERIIIVGDPHGCLDELKQLLVQCDYNPENSSVIVVGDLVNKGPHSNTIVSYCRSIGAFCVRGNHDEAALEYLISMKKKAHYEYLKEWSSEDIDWVTNLPYTIALPEFNAFIVHAGLVPGVPLVDQLPQNMTRIRNISEVSPGQYKAHEHGAEGSVAWGKAWSAEDRKNITMGCHVYFGHDAKRQLQLNEHTTGLDTGCCYGRKLTAVILPENKMVSLDAFHMYVDPLKKE